MCRFCLVFILTIALKLDLSYPIIEIKAYQYFRITTIKNRTYGYIAINP